MKESGVQVPGSPEGHGGPEGRSCPGGRDDVGFLVVGLEVTSVLFLFCRII